MTETTNPKPNWRLVAGLAVLTLAGGTVAIWLLPWLLDDHWLNGMATGQARATTVSGMRTALVALGAGLVAVVGLFYTHQTWQQTQSRDSDQRQLTWEGQVTDRFSKAVEQIASDKPVEQLGGIYALERIMRDSAKDHATIVEILGAFVREHAPAQYEPRVHGLLSPARQRWQAAAARVAVLLGGHTQPYVHLRPTEPVQAALTVLGRRPRDRDEHEPFKLNLAMTNLGWATLVEAHLQEASLVLAHLEGAFLIKADLKGAHLGGAHLEGAHLIEAVLKEADLGGAHLEGAYLVGAHLQGACLAEAHLQGATLAGADLTEVQLTRADLREVQDLTVEQLVSARPTPSTKLPEHLAADTRVMARIAAVVKEGRPTDLLSGPSSS
ncbi:pentapeptide repeat-containing protein [Streptomyces sp. NPDC057382]|uniref:pentapeptide repeat-containing protein n=1 Tax=unclassified Streptomyces TaxID=2593676 RepID=UPI003643AB83